MACRGPCEKLGSDVLGNPVCGKADGHTGNCSSLFFPPSSIEEIKKDAKEPQPSYVEKIARSTPRRLLLCSACRTLERMGYDFGENPLLEAWWEYHKAQDIDGDGNIKKDA